MRMKRLLTPGTERAQSYAEANYDEPVIDPAALDQKLRILNGDKIESTGAHLSGCVQSLNRFYSIAASRLDKRRKNSVPFLSLEDHFS